VNKTILALSIGLVLNSIEATAATLQPGDHLSIDTGSNFSMGAGAYGTVPLLGESGIIVGSALGDTGSGAHGGSPIPDDVGAVTQPWSFFYNTGYDYLSPDYGSGSFAGDTTNGVDMTSWTITWNTIAAIPMGGCFLRAGGCTQNPGSTNETVFDDTGIGNFEWSGVYGDTYTITYRAHTPLEDPSSFGGVQYDVVLTGIVTKSGELPPTSGVSIDLPGGSVYECSNGSAVINADVNIATTNPDDIVSINWTLNGNPVASGDSASIIASLGTHEIGVSVSTLESGTKTDTANISVNDTLAPALDAAFISSQTGEEVTMINEDVKSAMHSGNIKVVYSATDACDESPIVNATLGIEVVDDDKIKLNRRNNRLTLHSESTADSIVLSVDTTDASGNTATIVKELSQ